MKHLFKGFDVTIFAYGVTGTGKTHTMRGGKSLQDRGVIPRLLSSIYRRARKVEKDGAGESSVQVSMSYYEIYNDKVFDLFEARDVDADAFANQMPDRGQAFRRRRDSRPSPRPVFQGPSATCSPLPRTIRSSVPTRF